MKSLQKAYNDVMKASARLSLALQKLSLVASQIAGEDLNADLCEGDEVEFRDADDVNADYKYSLEYLLVKEKEVTE